MKKAVKWVEEDPDNKFVFWPTDEMKKKAWISDESIYVQAAKDPVAFWACRAKEGLDWVQPWTEDYQWNPPYYKWFVGGKINASYNALDRHLKSGRKDKVAIIWEHESVDEPNRVLTYNDLYVEVNKFANVLKWRQER